MSEKKYKGSCHCGAIRFEVVLDPSEPLQCNCSMCQKAGTLLSFVPEEKFNLISGADNLTDYRFNTEKINHVFCKTCGVRSFAKGQNGEGEPMYAVNVRCLDGIDPNALKPKFFDGKSI